MSRILVPRDGTQHAINEVMEWDPVDDLNTLIERILEPNEQHCKQAEKTPFADDHLASELENQVVVELIVNGVWTI
jgi:thiamine phosphate synthase YjbQ (UPF0047 family)